MKKVTPVIILGTLVGLFVWILSILGILSPLNGIFYDYLILYAPSFKSTSHPNVLIIEADSKFQLANDNTWLVLLDLVEKQQAKEVVFTFTPTQVSSQFYEQASHYSNVIFGRKVVEGLNNNNLERLEEVPSNASNIPLNFGVVRLPKSDVGIYRTQQKQVKINDQWYKTIETVAAEKALQQKTIISGAGNYGVNFSEGIEGLPILSLSRALSGDLIPELVKGRVVLIGFSDLDDNFVYTPLMKKNVMLTPLHFYGYSLETLLSSNAIKFLSAFWHLICIFLVIMLSIFLFKWIPNKYTLLSLLVLLCAYTLLTWSFLVFAKIWLPIAEFWMTQILIWISFAYYRNKSEDIQFQDMTIEMSAKLRQKIIPEYLYNSEEPWSKINAMMSQLVDLDSSVFLECKKEKYKMYVVSAYGYHPEQFNTAQNDYRLKPFSSAIEQKSMIKVDDLLGNNKEGQQQYIMPLLFLNDLQGFWIFKLNNVVSINEQLEVFLNNLGKKITELMFYRKQWFEQQRLGQLSWHRYFSIEYGRQLSKNVQKLFLLVEHQLRVVDDYIDHSNTASIVYDLFGRALIVNKQMLSILQKEIKSIYEMNMLDLIRALTNINQDDCRRIFQSLMIDDDKLKFDVTLSNQPDKYFVLNLSAINTNLRKSTSADTKYPKIEREGFLCELIDITDIKQAANLKEAISEQLGFKFRNDLASIVFSISILEKNQLTDTQRKRVFETLSHKSKDITKILNEAEQFLSLKISLSQIERYPINSQQVINNAVIHLQSEAQIKNIEIEVTFPQIINLVYASPKNLEQIISHILKYLILDAKTDSKIIIRAEMKDHFVIFIFSNQGFGIPNDLLQTYLADTETAIEDKNLRYIKEALVIVRSWGGELRCLSEVGVGTTFLLTLKGYF